MNRTIIPLFSLYLLCMVTMTACAPLNFKIFIRNTTGDSVKVSWMHPTLADTSTHVITLRSKNAVLRINNHALRQLDQSINAFANAQRVDLIIPSGTTVYASDMIKGFSPFRGNRLLVNTALQADTLNFNYPYRHIKALTRKRDPNYRYVYRTIIYMDIPLAAHR